MSVEDPREFHSKYVDAFNSGGVAAVLSLYEPQGAFVPAPDQVLVGHASIGESIQQFQSVGTMAGETRYCIVCGDVALASAAWEIKGTGPDGELVEVKGASTDLLRRQRDGRWLLVVDHPFGGS